MSDTKNDIAWGQLFDKYNIVDNVDENGFFEITSTEIKEFREARLATKFDHRNNLPTLFKKHKLNILPITRGSYVISRFNAYKEFEELNREITKVSFPDYIESIDHENITSEATALNCAYASGIIKDFIEDDGIVPAVSGRMSSLEFDFNIDMYRSTEQLAVTVRNSQIEIDGGYEGHNSLTLIEAKNSLSEDFLVRQLYYPYRLWQSKVYKDVKPVFMTYSNDIFSFYEYEFQDPMNYNSLLLVKQKNYIIEQEEITLDDIVEIMNTTQIVAEPMDIPSPQADSFPRIINLCEKLLAEERTKEFIYTNYDFDPRQSDYYTNAGRYLGLIEKRSQNRKPIYSISDLGRRILAQKYRARQLSFVRLILQHKGFNDALRLWLENGEMPSKLEITEIMNRANMNVEGPRTFKRRASTITGWINWILSLTN